MGPKVEPIPNKGFLFCPSDHTYWLDGRQIPGHSEIVQDARIYDLSQIPRETLRRATERGTKVHLATELLDRDNLDWSSVHPELLPYIDAWVSFKENEMFRPHPDYLEVPTWHKQFLYGITPDRFGDFHRDEGPVPAITEIKCTYNVEKYWGMQTAAQANALASHGKLDFDPKTVLRLAVKLNKDGTYTLNWHKNPKDFGDFMACLRTYGLRRTMK